MAATEGRHNLEHIQEHSSSEVSVHTAGRRGLPKFFTYVLIGIVLTAITIVEVAIFYVDGPKNTLIAGLLILGVSKFVLVALFYMHLKYDNRLFAGAFAFGLLLATSILVALLFMFRLVHFHG
jgi:cytochrome c oxidase subunit 4